MIFKVLTKFPNMSTLELTRRNPSILSTNCRWAFDGRKRQKKAKVATKLQRKLTATQKSAKYWQVRIFFTKEDFVIKVSGFTVGAIRLYRDSVHIFTTKMFFFSKLFILSARYSFLFLASRLITGSLSAHVSAEQVCPSVILQSPDVLRFGGWGRFNGEWWVVALVFVSSQVSANRRMSWLASGFLSAPTKDVVAGCQSHNLTLCKGPSKFALLSHRQLDG